MSFKAQITTWENQTWFEVSVESSFQGHVRVVVARGHESGDKPENYQGIDLTADECRSLATALESAARDVKGRNK